MHYEKRQIATSLLRESHKEGGGCIERCCLCARIECPAEDSTYLDTSGLQHGASVPSTSRLPSSLATHSHLPPAAIQKE